MEKFGGYKTEVKGRIESRETLALRNKVKEEVHLLIEIQRGVKTRCRNENVFARPNGLLDNAETGPARKYIYIYMMPAVGRRRRNMYRCALVAKQWRVKLTQWENVKCTRRTGMC